MSESAPTMRPYGRHMLICEHGDCAEPERAAALEQRFRALAHEYGLSKLRNPQRVKCSLSGCLGVCSGGPIVVVYPEGVWYHHVDEALFERIVREHIVGGRPVEEAVFHRMGPQPPEAQAAPPDAQPEDDSEAEPAGTLIGSSPEARRRRQEVRAAKRQKGLLIVNTGHGKGKTTAALGLLLRAWGRDLRLGGIQFFKHENANFGELRALERMGVRLTPMGDGFTWTSRNIEETQAKALHGWEVAKQRIASGEYDVFLLDEFTYVMHFGWLDPQEVLGWIAAHKPPALHLLITGRNAPPALVAAADMVTEMREIKHHFRDQGVKAQKGIEF